MSIVTISFNQVRFLKQAIESVLAQDYPDIEYIIVDPGSSDGSRSLIESFGSKIGKIHFKPDSGPSDGLNQGFALATGELYGFLNSDDVLLPGAVSKAVEELARRPKLDVVSGHGAIINDEGALLRKVYSDRYNRLLAAYGACILIQPSTFFRARIYRAVGGFNPANRSNWDGELFLDFALQGAKFGLVPSILSQYRVHAESITGSAKLKQLHEQYRERMIEKVRGRPITSLDKPLMSGLGVVRKLLNPLDTMERIAHGPVFGVANK